MQVASVNNCAAGSRDSDPPHHTQCKKFVRSFVRSRVSLFLYETNRSGTCILEVAIHTFSFNLIPTVQVFATINNMNLLFFFFYLNLRISDVGQAYPDVLKCG